MNTRDLLHWLGADAKAIADEYETQRQLAREAFEVDHTDAQADE
jgi:hypothetical protein